MSVTCWLVVKIHGSVTFPILPINIKKICIETHSIDNIDFLAVKFENNVSNLTNIRPGVLQPKVNDNRYGSDPMHIWTATGYNMQWTLLWGYHPNEMNAISHCYESVLQSHTLPCSFGGTLVFWNPVVTNKVACLACGSILDVIPMSSHFAELSSAERWFVELSHHACVLYAHHPDVISSATIQR